VTDIIRIQDKIYSWQSCSFLLEMIPYNGIKAFEVSDEAREREPVHVMKKDGRPVGKPSGKYKPPKIKLTMLRDSAREVMMQLTALALTQGGGSYGSAEFSMQLQVAEPIPTGVGLPVDTTVAVGCTVDGVSETQDESTGELLTEFTIGTLGVSRNGMTLYDPTRAL
jgi:hypothetical protein